MSLSKVKLACDVKINNKPILNVDACVERDDDEYLFTIRDRQRVHSTYISHQLDTFNVTKATYDKIKIKSTVRGTTITIKHVKSYSSAEDFKKFKQKLEQVISQQQTDAQEMHNQRSVFDDIDKMSLINSPKQNLFRLDPGLFSQKNNTLSKDEVQLPEVKSSAPKFSLGSKLNSPLVWNMLSSNPMNIDADQRKINDAYILARQGEAKRLHGDYQGALEDFNKADQLKPNDASTLKWRGDVKRVLGDYRQAIEDLNNANILLPTDVFILQSRGQAKRMLGDYHGALEDFNKADQLNPKQAYNLKWQGRVKIDLCDYRGALEDNDNAIKLASSDADAVKCRGFVKKMLGDYHGALADLNEAVRLDPNDSFALKHKGDTKRLIGDYRGALNDLNKANQLSVNDADVLKWRGDVKRSLGDCKGAVEDLNKADELKPNDSFTIARRGFINYLSGNYQSALNDMNKAHKLKSNDAFTLQWRGDVKRVLGDHKGALDDLNKADQLKPNDPIILKLRGNVNRMLGNYQAALNDLSASNQLAPNNKFTLQWSGAIKFVLDDYQGALNDLDRADRLKSNDSYTLKYRGAAHFMLDNYQEALEDLIKANQLAQDDEFILKYLGATEFMRDDYHSALNYLTLADRLKPHDPWILIRLGITKETLGDYRGALEDFNKACFIKPTDSVLWKHKGIVKYHLKDYLASEEDFLKAQSLAPEDEEIKDWLMKFKKQEAQPQSLVNSNSSLDGKPDWLTDPAQIKYSSPMLIKVCDKIKAKTDQQGRFILGQGGFGAVYLVEYNKTLAAMKQIIPHMANDKQVLQDFQKECELLRAIRHPNVLFFLGACLKQDNMFFLTEYMEHGDLFSLIANKDDNAAWEKCGRDIALQIALGLNHLHSNKIIHRDMKSLNVLIGRGYVAKIADVGLAKTKTQTATALTTADRRMTLLWASPEQMDIDQTVSFPSDIFSFGIILWELISQQRPYVGLTEKQLMMAIAKEKPIATLNPIPANCPPALTNLITDCWNYDPKKRPTAEQCIDILSQF